MMNQNEITEMLNSPPDLIAECDKCHNTRPLWVDYSTDDEWAQCEQCWQKQKKVMQKKEKKNGKIKAVR